ncbi:MAG: hypothetical protein FJZ43_01055 [Candidatus Staskawiczbacteria bacterium]|nr:hypothetical protein [Candidatus Staskawiczbacteria bacterium]
MKKNNQKGSVSRLILVLAGVVLVIAAIIFIAISITSRKTESENNQNNQSEVEDSKQVYEATVGDIRLIMQSSFDAGSILKSSTSNQTDLETTERFIKVTIGAQNKGKVDTDSFTWDLGNIVDSEGRNFVPITNKAFNFLPRPDLCGSILKPEFAPVSCVRIYEVSRQSEGLKIQVISKVPKVQSVLLDLKIN